MGLVRINEDKLEMLLKLSGHQGLWAETPISHRHVYTPIWIGTSQEQPTLQQALDKSHGTIPQAPPVQRPQSAPASGDEQGQPKGQGARLTLRPKANPG